MLQGTMGHSDNTIASAAHSLWRHTNSEIVQSLSQHQGLIYFDAPTAHFKRTSLLIKVVTIKPYKFTQQICARINLLLPRTRYVSADWHIAVSSK